MMSAGTENRLGAGVEALADDLGTSMVEMILTLDECLVETVFITQCHHSGHSAGKPGVRVSELHSNGAC